MDYFRSILSKFEEFRSDILNDCGRHNDDVTYNDLLLNVWRIELLADCSQNRQSAKINSPPK